MYQYRLTVNGSVGAVLNTYPGDQWSRIADVCEERGLCAIFERRLITDTEILDLVCDTTGYIKIGAKVACAWEIMAEMRY